MEISGDTSKNQGTISSASQLHLVRQQWIYPVVTSTKGVKHHFRKSGVFTYVLNISGAICGGRAAKGFFVLRRQHYIGEGTRMRRDKVREGVYQNYRILIA
ncbi:unnamed protein product [Callosobruchus maculatus]|uniref:Uncharacterized protein n=1 Tax=Callosobruchus maculatus TaxID=64391 RepID=A0A653BG65_CALMS|nr:unnamed protein product [Callosobruchus maculatus]